MSFPKAFLDELKGRIRVSEVVGRKVKLTRRGREFVGLSPFSNEKSPSFTVNDDKQFYHCFSSGEHGDVIKFLEKTENLSFIEAVERLVAEAGMEMPERDPFIAEKEKKKASLVDVMEMAAEFFERQLRSDSGKEAHRYLIRRGLSEETIKEFRLGFSLNSRTALISHMKSMGVTLSQMEEAGLVISGPDIQEPYDRFRNRVMFPISDARGRTIGFGGRTLDPEGKPKYLNSPETPLFHKGDVLFNFVRARKPAFDTGTVLVVEGYMDAISLYAAGVKNVVAALGTAITERQVSELWRLAPEPVICLDGDAAGARAAGRLIDRTLPLLKSGYALRFAYLPSGQDPDDFVKANGSDGIATLVYGAKSFADALYERETGGAQIDTPERKAGLSRRFDELIAVIEDRTVQRFYRQLFNIRLSRLFWSYDRENFSLARMSMASETPTRVKELEEERILLGALVEHPDIFDLNQDIIQETYFASPIHARFRNELIRILVLPGVTEIATFYEEIDDGFFVL
ncbi:MAG: DNA primase, partial [Hoeflea sp.]